MNRTCPSVIGETLEIMATVPLQYIYYLENLGLESWWNQWFGFMLRILTGHSFICNFRINFLFEDQLCFFEIHVFLGPQPSSFFIENLFSIGYPVTII